MDQLGINDYKHAFLHGKSICEMSHLVPEVVETIKSSVEKLINEPGVKQLWSLKFFVWAAFLVFGLCEGDPIRKNRICHRGLNMFSKLHNNHLYSGAAIKIP